MNAETIIFYILSVVILTLGYLTVTTQKIFRAATYLLFTLVLVAGLYIYMGYNFLAGVQIAVYAGGIVVLIIFSVLLTQNSGEEVTRTLAGRRVVAFLLALSGFSICMYFFLEFGNKSVSESAMNNSVSEIGTQMLSLTEHGYLLPFEAVSMLLLAAMVGAIIIAVKLKPKQNDS